LGAAIEWARSRKLRRLVLWVTEGNGPATRLYERQGFADTGQRDALQSNPKLRIMQMTLTL
jgi:GNAT superfamily N-acetyltransferase